MIADVIRGLIETCRGKSDAPLATRSCKDRADTRSLHPCAIEPMYLLSHARHHASAPATRALHLLWSHCERNVFGHRVSCVSARNTAYARMQGMFITIGNFQWNRLAFNGARSANLTTTNESGAYNWSKADARQRHVNMK